MKSSFLFILFAACVVSFANADVPGVTMPSDHRALLKLHCYKCHNAGEMPLDDEERLPDKAKTDFLDDLSNPMVAARKSLNDQGGVSTMRQLNRQESNWAKISLSPRTPRCATPG